MPVVHTHKLAPTAVFPPCNFLPLPNITLNEPITLNPDFGVGGDVLIVCRHLGKTPIHEVLVGFSVNTKLLSSFVIECCPVVDKKGSVVAYFIPDTASVSFYAFLRYLLAHNKVFNSTAAPYVLNVRNYIEIRRLLLRFRADDHHMALFGNHVHRCLPAILRELKKKQMKAHILEFIQLAHDLSFLDSLNDILHSGTAPGAIIVPLPADFSVQDMQKFPDAYRLLLHWSTGCKLFAHYTKSFMTVQLNPAGKVALFVGDQHDFFKRYFAWKHREFIAMRKRMHDVVVPAATHSLSFTDSEGTPKTPQLVAKNILSITTQVLESPDSTSDESGPHTPKSPVFSTHNHQTHARRHSILSPTAKAFKPQLPKWVTDPDAEW